MDQICEPFWDNQLTWNTTIPDFTECFQNTVLIWIPCGFLVMLAPYEVWQQTRSTTPSIRWNFLNGTKLVVDFILVVLSLALFISNTLTQSLNGGNIVLHTIGQGILTITYIIVAILIVRGRKRGMHTSGTLFVFWILQTISGLLIYRSIFLHVLDGTTIVDVVRVLINMTSFPLIVVELLLSCLADSTPEHKLSDKRLCPEESSSMLSQIIFWWINPLIIKGYRRPLTIDDQWTLTSKHRCESLVERFQRSWQSELSKNKRSCLRKGVYRPSVFMTIIKTFWPSFLAGFIFKLSADLLQFVGPQILSLLISFVSSNEPTWKGLLYVAILFSTSILHSILENRYFFYMYVVAMETRSAVAAAVYSKSLKLSNKERRSSTVGEIVNLMSIDTQVLLDLIPFVNVIWSSPLQIILSMYFLWQVLGPSVLTGIGLMVLLLPLNGVIANFAHRYQVDNMKHKDNRTKSMSEILNGIKVLKLYAWELPFIDTVLGIRSLEVKLLKKIGYVTAVSEMLWNGATFLVAIGSFATFIFVDKSNVLTPNVAFVSLSLFNIIRFPLMMFPTLMTEIIQTLVSIRRLNKFMRSEELDRNSIDRQPSQDCAIRIRDGCFSWGDEDETEVLRDINVDLKTGSLVAVVGQVGSGKSSLVSGIIGELEKKSGYVGIKGSLSYVPQTAWIRNDTIKGNVVMQKPFDDKTYTDVIQSCALSTDLDILPGGDRTEIGEKGINLSGGQKQRISLARAAYHQTDIYLLDDPLSAVDSNVGKHIFEQVIGPKGLLRYKTRVLVTHGISYLPECDSVIVLKEGRISEVGTYQYLLSKNGAFADFLTQYANESSTNVEQENFESNESVTKEHIQHGVKRQQSYDKRSEQMSERETLRRFTSGTELLSHHDEDNLIHKAKLIEIEEASTGQVPWFVYLSYIKTVGCSTFVGIIFCWIVAEGFYTASNVWLSAWSMDPSPINGTIDTELRDLRLGIYGVFGVAQAIFLLLGAFGIAYFTIQSSAILHARMLNSIMKSPMSFFDTTPMGRIINRFAKDINVMDVNLINNIRDFLLCLFSVLATTVVISIESPIFLAVMVPLLFVYFFVQRVYIASSRQLRRLESITRSPIYVHFSESLMGASSIRAYQFQEDFIDENNQKLDENQICYFPAVSVNRWLAINLSFISSIIILFASLSAVLLRGSVDPGVVGLSVSYAMNMTAELNWMVRMAGELETNMVAVERVIEYTKTSAEAPWNNFAKRPKDCWPAEGAIDFEGYATRYRPGLDLVVKNINCNIRPSEKIGICGRTGAGKSSLTLALFRLIEPAKGKIIIDDIDVSQIGLHDLRSKLTIIPQEPVLFSGTLRRNLDPFNDYTDAKLWEALDQSHLKSFVSGLDRGLNYEVAEGGENLSVGQRQLVCLARALLRYTKILILDEATAAVDLETDDLIQDTIRKEFHDCTVLTIAHRLNTILDSSRIMVLDNGYVSEFDRPSELLKNKESIFYRMAKDGGII